MKLCLTLFYEFFKTGLFSVGGGLATVPFLQRMSITHPDWFTTAELADMIAVSESTPGPIGVNMATFVGFRTFGVLGAVIATLGLIVPEIIIILLISRALEKFRTNRFVDAGFYGIRPCSIGLIAAAGLLVAKLSFFRDGVLSLGTLNYKALALGILLIVLTRLKKVKDFHPVVFIAFSAAVGIAFSF